ncbi:protein of unknown function [Limnospira indica PCC 8005]|uniref:Uncharacterized protein n=1 Tax=Limnospira indica PCC 8005 TaxID=376219 RepID=A0A9P1NXX3_9CYAN|nr:protein of unknown function [Limnospira indica PCC 8005]
MGKFDIDILASYCQIVLVCINYSEESGRCQPFDEKSVCFGFKDSFGLCD